ncbi:hypothetical protein AAMO2058_001055100 [Amorphochlora amoebiformis]
MDASSTNVSASENVERSSAHMVDVELTMGDNVIDVEQCGSLEGIPSTSRLEMVSEGNEIRIAVDSKFGSSALDSGTNSPRDSEMLSDLKILKSEARWSEVETDKSPLQLILMYASSSPLDEREFHIAQNYMKVKSLQKEVACKAKRVALMSEELENAKKMISQQVSKENKRDRHSSSGDTEIGCARIIALFQKIKKSLDPDPKLSQGDSLCLQHCSKMLYYLFNDGKYIAYLLQILRKHPSDNSNLITLVCSYMYEEHWSHYKDTKFVDLIEITLHSEADRCIDFPNTYLRGECPPIKLLSAYLRQADCRKVLTDTLGENFILGAVSQHDFTMNPHSVATELCIKLGKNLNSSSPEVIEVLKGRIEPLSKVCESFLGRIMRCNLPPGIRKICRVLGDVARKKCPGDPKVVDFLIGGFIFLRFFNPYILDNSNGRSKRVRDSLIMVTKVLQNISNRILYKRDKKFMHLLNPYLETKFKQVHSFFSKVTAKESPRVMLDEAMGRSPSCFVRMKTSSLSYLFDIIKRYQSDLQEGLKLKHSDPLLQSLGAMGDDSKRRRKGAETVASRVSRWRHQAEVIKWCSFWVMKGPDVNMNEQLVNNRRELARMRWSMQDGKVLLKNSDKIRSGFLGTASDLQEMKTLVLCGAPSGTVYFMWYRESKDDEKTSKVYAWSVGDFCSLGSPNINDWASMPGAVSGKALLPALSKLVRVAGEEEKVKTLLDTLVEEKGKEIDLSILCERIENLAMKLHLSELQADFQDLHLQAKTIRNTGGSLNDELKSISVEIYQRKLLHRDLLVERRLLEEAKVVYRSRLKSTQRSLAALEIDFRKKIGEPKGIIEAVKKTEPGHAMLHVSIEEIVGGLLTKFVSDVAKSLEGHIGFAEKRGTTKTDGIPDILFSNFNPTLDESEWQGQLARVFPRNCSFYNDTMVKISTLCDCCVDVAVGQVIRSLPHPDGAIEDIPKENEGQFSWYRFYSLVPSLRNQNGDFSKPHKELADLIIDIMATDVLLAALQHFSPDSKEGAIKSNYRLLLRRAIPKFGLSDVKCTARVKEVRNYVASRWALVLGSICPFAAADLCSLFRLAILPIHEFQKSKRTSPFSIREWLNHHKFSIAISAVKSKDQKELELKLPQGIGITKMATIEELCFFLKAIYYLRFDHTDPVCISRVEKLIETLTDLLQSPLKLTTKIKQDQQIQFHKELLKAMERMIRGLYFAKGLDINKEITSLYLYLLKNKTVRNDILHVHSKRLAATIILRSHEEFFKAHIQHLLSNHLLKGIIRANRVKSEHLAVLLHFLRGAEGERYYGMPWIKYEGREAIPVGFQRFGRLYHKLSSKYLEEIAQKIFVHKRVGNEPELTSISERIIVQMACHDPSVVQHMLLQDILEWDATKKNWGRTFQNRHLLALRCLECLVMENSGYQEFMASLSASPTAAEYTLGNLNVLFVKDRQIVEVFNTLMTRAEQAVGIMSGNTCDTGIKESKNPSTNITFDRLSELVLSVLDKTPWASSTSLFARDKSKRGLAHYVYFYALRLLPKILPSSFFQPSEENCIGDEKAADPAMFPGRLIVHEDSMFSDTASESLHTIVRESLPPMQSYILQCFIKMLHDKKMTSPSCICSILREMESLISEWRSHISTSLDSNRDANIDRRARGPSKKPKNSKRAHTRALSQGGNNDRKDGGEAVMDSQMLHERFPELSWHCEADAIALIYANHEEKDVRVYAVRLMNTIRDLIRCKLAGFNVHPDSLFCVQDVWELRSAEVIDAAVQQMGTRLGRVVQKKISMNKDLLSVCNDYNDEIFYMQLFCALAREMVDTQLSITTFYALNYLCRIKCFDPMNLYVGSRALFQAYFSMLFALSGAPILCPPKLKDGQKFNPGSYHEICQDAAKGTTSVIYLRLMTIVSQLWEIVLDKHVEDELCASRAAYAVIESHPAAHLLVLRNMLEKYYSMADSKSKKHQSKKALPFLTHIMQCMTSSQTHRRAIISNIGDDLIRTYLMFIQGVKIQLWNPKKVEKVKWYETQVSLITMIRCLCSSIASTFSGRYLSSRISQSGNHPSNPSGYTSLFDKLLPLQYKSTVMTNTETERPITRAEIFDWLTSYARDANEALQMMDKKGHAMIVEGAVSHDHKLKIKHSCMAALCQLATLGKCVDKKSVGSCVQKNGYFLSMTDEESTKAWDSGNEGVQLTLNQLSLLHPDQPVRLVLNEHTDKALALDTRNLMYRLTLGQVHDSELPSRMWYRNITHTEMEKPVCFNSPKKTGMYLLVLDAFKRKDDPGAGLASGYSIDGEAGVIHTWKETFRVEHPKAHILPALLLFFHPTQLLAQFLAEAISSESGKARLCVKAIIQVFTTDLKPLLNLLPQSPMIARMIGPERFAAWSRSQEFRDVGETNLDKLLFMALYQLGSRDRDMRFVTFQMLTCVARDWELISTQDQMALKRYSFAFESGITTTARSYAIKISKLLARSVAGFAQKLITLSFNALGKLRDPEWILTFLLPWAGFIDLKPPKNSSKTSSAFKYSMTTATSPNKERQTKNVIPKTNISVTTISCVSIGETKEDSRNNPMDTKLTVEESSDQLAMGDNKERLQPTLGSIPTSTAILNRKRRPRIMQQGQNKLLYDLLQNIKKDRLRERMVDFLVELGRNEDNVVTIVAFMLGKVYEVMRMQDDADYITQIKLRQQSTVIQGAIHAIYSRVSRIRIFMLELFFQCMREHLSRDSVSTRHNSTGTHANSQNIGQLQRSHIRFDLYEILNNEMKALDKSFVERILREQERLIAAMVVEFIGIDREVVRPWLPEMVVYAIIALAKKNQNAEVRDVMCNLLVRLIAAFETNQGSLRTQRATDELEQLVGSFEVKDDKDAKREITSHLLRVFRVECPICVPQIGRAAFKWGVLSKDISITRMAFTAYECLLEPLEETKTSGKQSLKGSMAFTPKSRSRSLLQPSSDLPDVQPENEFAEPELVGMDSRVAIHTLLVRLMQILQGCSDYSYFLPHRVTKMIWHAEAILTMIWAITRHLASIGKLHNHPSLLWTGIALLRCDQPSIYNVGLDILAHLKSYHYLTVKREIPQSFWTYSEGWNPRFTGVLLSLIPGMLNPLTEGKTMDLLYRLIRLPSNSLIGLDTSSKIRQVISIVMFLPWLHLSLRTDKIEGNPSQNDLGKRTSLTPTKVLSFLAKMVSTTEKDLADVFAEFARPEVKSSNKFENRGDLFLQKVCAGIADAYFPTYALPCAHYLAAVCKSECRHYHNTAFAAVNHMITADNAQTYILAFQPIIEIAQNAVVEGSNSTFESFGPESSSASAQIMRAVMEVLLDKKNLRGNEVAYRRFDVLPLRNMENTLSALRKVIKATPSF